MEKLNISKSIISISSPGTNLTPGDNCLAADMTRQINDEISSVCRAHPSHFRFFASLPLPAVPESLAEIDYALDKLGAVGFILLSNLNGVYLGDEALDPVLAKLNEREGIVFLHPTTCQLIVPQGEATGVQTVKPLPQFPSPMMEFFFDETRAVMNLLLSRTLTKYPDITFIMTHCGCVLPPLIERVGRFDAVVSGGESKNVEYKKLLRERFFFDLAGLPFPEQIHGLLKVLGKGGEERMVYGSDYPWTPEKAAIELAGQMDEGCEELFEMDGRKNIYFRNAAKLFSLSDNAS